MILVRIMLLVRPEMVDGLFQFFLGFDNCNQRIVRWFVTSRILITSRLIGDLQYSDPAAISFLLLRL